MNIEQAVRQGTGGVFQFSAAKTGAQQLRLPATLQPRLINSANVKDKTGFLEETAAAMRFPDYFGGNWDAFYDCLTDCADAIPQGTIMIFTDLSRFAREAPGAFRMAVDVMTDAAAYREQTGSPLLVLVGLDDPELATQLQSITNV